MTQRERQILEWIRQDPMISQQELAEKAGITRSSAAVHISNLMKKGYITDSTVDCYFVENVEVKQEYVDQSLIMNLGYIAEKLNATKAGEVTYTVKSGDVWSLIAEDNGMTNEELLALNPGYDISVLHTGDVLTISRAVPYLTMWRTAWNMWTTRICMRATTRSSARACTVRQTSPPTSPLSMARRRPVRWCPP